MAVKDEGKPMLGDPPLIDPTILTTQQLHREIEGERALTDSKIEGLRTNVQTQLDAADRAITSQQARLDARQTDIDKSIAHVTNLFAEKLEGMQGTNREKFASIGTQFLERDKRTEQLSIADKTAIAAALQAQKEAAGATNESNLQATTKMEANFTKLIEKTQDLVSAVQRNTDEKINDVKSRLDKGDGQTSVSDPAVAHAINQLINEVQQLKTTGNKIESKGPDWITGLAVIGGVIGIVVGIIAMVIALKH
jgi:hypothetical protein